MEEREYALQMIEEIRQGVSMVLNHLDSIQARIESGEDLTFSGEPRTLPFSTPPHFFKGQRPMAVTFPDGDTFSFPTWKATITAILKDCNADPERHERMMELCGKVLGRQRCILSHDPFDMDVPLKIDDGMYFEGKFDTEYLIKMMTERVFPYVGYDYKGITVTLRPERQRFPVQQLPDEESYDQAEAEDEASSQQMTM